MRWFAVLVLFLAGTSQAKPASNRTSELLGLVEIPRIFGLHLPGGPPGQSKPREHSPVRLHAKPDRRSPAILTLSSPEDVAAREHDYDELSAEVYDRRDGWYLIGTKSGRGWLAPHDAGQFRSFESLIKAGLSFLKRGTWNGLLHFRPGEKADFKPQLETDEKEVDVQIKAVQHISGRLWFQVQLVQGRCEGEEKLGQIGWVPGYSPTGAENLWFYSRGC